MLFVTHNFTFGQVKDFRVVEFEDDHGLDVKSSRLRMASSAISTSHSGAIGRFNQLLFSIVKNQSNVESIKRCGLTPKGYGRHRGRHISHRSICWRNVTKQILPPKVDAFCTRPEDLNVLEAIFRRLVWRRWHRKHAKRNISRTEALGIVFFSLCAYVAPVQGLVCYTADTIHIREVTERWIFEHTILNMTRKTYLELSHPSPRSSHHLPLPSSHTTHSHSTTIAKQVHFGGRQTATRTLSNNLQCAIFCTTRDQRWPEPKHFIASIDPQCYVFHGKTAITEIES